MVDVMNRNLVWIIIIASSFGYSSAWAQDDAGGDEAETTIRLMGAAEAELPDAVTKEIALPDSFLKVLYARKTT
jgi:hypothetical protein